MMMWGDFGGAGWGIGLAVLHLLWWVLLIAAGALLLRWALAGPAPRRDPAPGRDGGPEAILRERFARGEIQQEEYEQRLRILRG